MRKSPLIRLGHIRRARLALLCVVMLFASVALTCAELAAAPLPAPQGAPRTALGQGKVEEFPTGSRCYTPRFWCDAPAGARPGQPCACQAVPGIVR